MPATTAQLSTIVDALQAYDRTYLAAADRISALHPDTMDLPEVRAMEAARDVLLATVLEVGGQHLVGRDTPAQPTP